MAPKFGTSGLRGLVTELTDALVSRYTLAFLATCPTGKALCLGRDLRPSSKTIAEAVADAATQFGLDVLDCGELPTPALALFASQNNASAIMVTGSHIPADRNGLKFYRPDGEISKNDETAILSALDRAAWPDNPRGAVVAKAEAARNTYLARYTSAFGANALSGLRIGIYQHSSVARDMLVSLVDALGGTAVVLGRSNVFIPVDTEALDPQTTKMLAGWCRQNDLDAVFSTDGDADRPMLADADGTIIPGDVLGVLTARFLGAQVLCTPVSSNSMVSHMPEFARIELTRIGSPYVIAAMDAALEQNKAARVVGYEANGGFLLGFSADGPAGPLPALPTRDAVLPLIAPLSETQKRGQSLREIRLSLPSRFTASDRLTEIPTARSKAFLAALDTDPDARAAFLSAAGLAEEAALDKTDGLRMTLADSRIVHLRPSGNAPEFRCYVEAADGETARQTLKQTLSELKEALSR